MKKTSFLSFREEANQFSRKKTEGPSLEDPDRKWKLNLLFKNKNSEFIVQKFGEFLLSDFCIALQLYYFSWC